MTGQTAFIFTHGISNGADDRARMPERVKAFLQRFHALSLFTQVDVACWRSLGEFEADLVDLSSPLGVRNREAVTDVAVQISAAIERVLRAAARREPDPPDTIWPRIVVCGHSMGQPIVRLALHEVAKSWKSGRAPLPIGLFTLGGPMGNASRLVTGWLDRWVPKEMRSMIPPPFYLQEWVDIWNGDDIVCAPKLLGYRPMPGVRAVELDFPGVPLNPMQEHGSYFEHPMPFDELRAMVERLTDISRRWSASSLHPR